MACAFSGMRTSAVALGLLLGGTAAQQTTHQQEKVEINGTWYWEGNTVPNRDVPPMPGCTVYGKVYWPLAQFPLTDNSYTLQNGWDWCQKLCKDSLLPTANGSYVPCAHFAYFPDGKCFLQDSNTTLVEAPACGTLHPCENNFEVVSGPADCKNKASWVFPPGGVTPEIGPEPGITSTEAPTFPPTLPPPTLPPFVPPTLPPTLPPMPTLAPVPSPAPVVIAAPVLVDVPEATTLRPLAKLGESCNPTLSPPYEINCEEGLDCITADPSMMGASGICSVPETTTTTTTAGPTVPPPPPGATIVGYLYTPHTMEGTVKAYTSDWYACYNLCVSNPLCQHFGYWPDEGCHQQGNNAMLVKATCNATTPDCPGLKVLSGPRNLTDRALWPVVPTGQALGNADVSAPVFAAQTMVAADSGGGGMPTLVILGLIATMIIGGGALAAYQTGALNSVLGNNPGEGEDLDGDVAELSDGDSDVDSKTAMLP
eukprot:CAMPEP_0177478298 /NCGR_PEP_ID=MMETSP0369-20130122/24608_1 /TAXON_ID=447022 ORGANISM="Scrippsiella hangoei-like, Strain SHHI-4" /NCGR_SAMPLE_ID=MMETSP0369 /ASSEMBLY_ACC=CAM_ASM_000364 /LENGTH=482 /DNA_ID=CAMNT_0018953711 /DNA_START=17 /DNA_END=1465 /DNA_ORIENTATION=-